MKIYEDDDEDDLQEVMRTIYSQKYVNITPTCDCWKACDPKTICINVLL